MSDGLEKAVKRLKIRDAQHLATIRSLTTQIGELTERLRATEGHDEATSVLSSLLTEAMEQRAAALARADALVRIVRERNADIAALRMRLGMVVEERHDENDGPLVSP